MYLVEVFVALRCGVGPHEAGVYRVRYPGERMVDLEPVAASRDGGGVGAMPVDAALQNAPNRLADFFGVPAVFDTDEPVSH